MTEHRHNRLPSGTALILAAIGGLLSDFTASSAHGAEKPGAPNIVFILADDKY